MQLGYALTKAKIMCLPDLRLSASEIASELTFFVEYPTIETGIRNLTLEIRISLPSYSTGQRNQKPTAFKKRHCRLPVSVGKVAKF